MVKLHCLDVDKFNCDIEWTNVCTCEDISEDSLSLYHDPKHFGGGQYFIDHFFNESDILEKLKVDNSIMEMCSGPGYMGYYLATKLNLNKAIFVDINDEVREGHTKSKDFFDFTTEFHLSETFDQYEGDKVDLIVLNPPHVITEEQYWGVVEYIPDWFPDETQGKLLLLDENFKFHQNFCKDAHNYLNENGKIVFTYFYEGTISSEDIKKELGEDYSYEKIYNPGLNSKGELDDEKDPHKNAYILIATRK